ncbi:MFS transporter [Marinimicrobium alkaliphilum]|uniref:MFS transporter n=1 Tax=Marinimicrobium alkaliphilum TaxID=2202654 RepID=UPI000DBAD81D|nr:MFS transporter [Marinimicrobium alkaliphilum]
MMRTALSLSSLFASLILLVSGNAFLMTLLGLRLSMEAFAPSVIGWILVCYSFGFVFGTLYAGNVIQRVGHIRSFAVFAALLSVAILVHALAVDPWLWGFLRAIAGFMMAGLMIVVESWFSSRADNKNRASLFAFYQVVFYLSTAGGQVLIRASEPTLFVPFSLAAMLVILALVPLSMTRRQSPDIEQSERLSLWRLYRESPVGALGAMVAGFLISSFYAMGPVFADRIGFALNEISNFMAIAILAAMLLAWPVGRLCDRFDRYRVMLVASVIAAVASAITAVLAGFSPILSMVFVGLYMGIAATLYPIGVAMTNDVMDSHRITAASTALLLSYGVGSCIGPLASALFMEWLGARGLFVASLLVLGLFSAFIALQPRHRHPSVEEQEDFFLATPEAGLGLQDIDPRNPDFEPGMAVEPPSDSALVSDANAAK